jgi:hypothetical protein
MRGRRPETARERARRPLDSGSLIDVHTASTLPLSPETRPLTLIRVALLAILVFGLVGTVVELLLLEHTEDIWQWVPIVLIGMGLAVIGWHVVQRGAASTRSLQGTMLLFVASGIVGVILHYKGNVEFEIETYPTLRGLELFKEAMMGATPALAPGTMIQLGLIGLAYAYRHPSLIASTDTDTTTTGL